MENTQQSIILFDGVCNFCDASVQFILKHDAKEEFLFSSLQSQGGQAILTQYHLPTKDFNTFVLISKGKAYTRSTAALKVVKGLGGAWPLLYAFIVVPPVLRDMVYAFIAQNRYRWFGKKDACMIPSPEVRSRFLP